MSENPIKAWRERDRDHKVSQEALAKLIGVKPMTVSRWERGSHLPNKRHWPKIEEATGIAPSQLVEHLKEDVSQ